MLNFIQLMILKLQENSPLSTGIKLDLYLRKRPNRVQKAPGRLDRLV